MASSPQKNLQFISPPKEAGDFLQNQVKFVKYAAVINLILFIEKGFTSFHRERFYLLLFLSKSDFLFNAVLFGAS